MSDADEMDEIVDEFLVESQENLDRLDAEFVLLENDPGSAELLGSIFRTIHTIKGTAAFLDFGQLEAVSHAGENLLSLLRDGVMVLDSHLTTALLEMVDAIRATLDVIERERSDASVDLSELATRLAALASGDAPESAPADVEPEPVGSELVEPELVEPELVAPELVEPELVETQHEVAEAEPVVEAEVQPEPVETQPVVEAEAQPVVEAPPEAAGAAGAAGGGAKSADSSIRVDVELLDRLMNLVSELVLARNQIRQYVGGVSGSGFDTAVQQLDLVTGELQQAVMETRMQPVGNLWGRMPRMVRDLATTCGKRVSLELEGGETELDKTLLEAIRDPLTHIVRNSVDHGLEDPDTRVAKGKPATGSVQLRARHEGGQVVIEVIDDGAGLDLDAIARKVVERGLMSQETVAGLSERELANLIFLPGLSTAKAVTKVSGRGVGMDVVKRSIDEIGGAIEIQTEPGQGTTLTLRIPLTLAIIPALTVNCGAERYLIPQLNVLELHRVDASAPIELVGGTPLFRLRGELLPLVHWRDVLADDQPSPGDFTDKYIVVLYAHGLTFGFVVDGVESTEEIVVKPLRAHLKDIPAFAGSTVLGDGSVALILDPIGLTLFSGLSADNEDGRLGSDEVESADSGETETVLVCEAAGGRVAFPLDGVTRLENFAPDAVEHASGVEVVPYRGRLMRLVRYGASAWAAEGTGGDRLLVLVHENDDDVSGIVVERIIEVRTVSLEGNRPGVHPVRYSVPIDGTVTDVIDAASLVGAGGSYSGAF